jgi:Spy/CpxP family protein refolding chaperone
MLQDRLNLTPEQRDKVKALQADVDRQLASILTDEQKQQIQEMRNRGPARGPGGPGEGPGGPGGPGRGRQGGPGDEPPPPPGR